jgi:ferric-dicitrate binding protein FerR (iron transport regulator)
MITDHSDFESLCQSVIEGMASEAQCARLRACLHANQTLRAEFCVQMRLHALLSWQQGLASDAAVVKPKPMKVMRLATWRPALAAAAAVVLMAVWFALRSSHQGVAMEVVSADEVPFQAGQRLSLDRLKLESGSMKFRLDSGALVEVDGPADVELLSAMRLRLRRGNVTTDVGDQAKGFVIETANAHVVDLGTRFGVNVGGTGSTDVVVFEGKVDVFEAQKNGKPSPQFASLTEGDALRVDSPHTARRLSTVPLRGDSRAMLHDGAAQTSVVARISDNLDEDKFHRYYSIVPGGMGEGGPVYSAPSHIRWLPLPGKTFPSQLVGADVVGTFNADRKDQDMRVELELTTRCAVYVMLDIRGPAPAWLERDFTDTGLRLRSGPWGKLPVTRKVEPDADGAYYLTYSVWRREVPAGTLELGAPHARSQDRSRTMYGIAVKRQP